MSRSFDNLICDHTASSSKQDQLKINQNILHAPLYVTFNKTEMKQLFFELTIFLFYFTPLEQSQSHSALMESDLSFIRIFGTKISFLTFLGPL